MRIHPPELTAKDGLVTLRASVSLERDGQNIPDELWFTVPQRFEHLCSRGVEPFVVALSSLASARNEEIQIEGPFSERLSVGLNEYWKIINLWQPERFHPVRLNGGELVPEMISPGHAAAAFSGGVDSFFTQFLSRNRPAGFRTKYAMFAHGFDIPLKDVDIYESAAAKYEVLLAEMGVELIKVKTNARAFLPGEEWEMAHGSILSGTALILSSGINRFFVPSSMSYLTLRPWGSHPLIDSLLSTDQMQIIHDGADTRFDKLRTMKDWAPLQAVVRTCYEHPDAFHNCGHCRNCRQTMMMLASLGVLEKFPTFPKVRTPSHFVRCNWDCPHERRCAAQAIAFAEQRGAKGLAWAGRISLLASNAKRHARNARVRTRPFRRALTAIARRDRTSDPHDAGRR
jgi:hypothetical protein